VATTSELKREYRRILTYSRLGALSYMYYYDKDGILYQELKSVLVLKDSTLAPQLRWLKEKGYAKANDEDLDSGKIVVYYITDEGRRAYREVLNWLDHLPTLDAAKE